mgnify:CR=1 FL=1
MSGMSPEQSDRVFALVRKLSGSDEGADVLARALDASGMSLMKKATLENFPGVTDPDRLENSRTGIIIDTETTGLDDTDEVVELAMLRFRYDDQGVLSLDAVYNELREPSCPMTEEASRITGITDKDLAGKSIPDADVARFLDGAEVVVAHHAAFDRKMAERTFPEAGFDKMPWRCSLEEVDWTARGKNGRSLEVLALGAGYTYGSHRADADVIATAFVLNGQGENSPFSEMLETGARDTIHVIAKDSPFHSKDALKEAGFKWSNDGSEAHGHRAWHKEVPDVPEKVAEVAELLRSRKVYGKEMALPSYRVDAMTRYSGRKPGGMEMFRTANAPDISSSLEQQNTELPGLN